MFSSTSYNTSLSIPVKATSFFTIIFFKLVSLRSDWYAAPDHTNQLLTQMMLHQRWQSCTRFVPVQPEQNLDLSLAWWNMISLHNLKHN